MSVRLFPTFRSHEEVRCWKCGATMQGHSESGFGPKDGEFRGQCSACQYRTFYDVGTPEAPRHATRAFRARRRT